MNYTCPECKTTHSSAEWDKATQEFYETDIITSIEDEKDRAGCTFNCPNCNKEIDYDYMSFVNEAKEPIITIFTKEYKELLEIKAMYEGLCK